MIPIRDNIKGGALTETTFLVLLALYRPNHGYGIMQFVERETNRRVILGAGTLYGAINALLKKRWIRLIAEEKDTNKKTYLITDIGKRIAIGEQDRIEALRNLAGKIMGADPK